MIQQSVISDPRRLFDRERLKVRRCESLPGWLIYDSALDEYIKHIFLHEVEALVVCQAVSDALCDLVRDRDLSRVVHGQFCIVASVLPELVVASYTDQYTTYGSIVRELRFEMMRLYVRSARERGDIDACGVWKVVSYLVKVYKIYAEKVALDIASTLERYRK